MNQGQQVGEQAAGCGQVSQLILLECLAVARMSGGQPVGEAYTVQSGVCSK